MGIVRIFLVAFLNFGFTHAQEIAVLETTHGLMHIALDPEAAPKTVKNFKDLVESNWYVGKTFYRVVAGHVIQAGSNDEEDIMTKNAKVPAEFNGPPHIKGAVGLARDDDPNSGSTEIYICHEPRPHLDGRFTIFGQLVDGFDTLDAIATLPVLPKWQGDVAFHAPVQEVIINSIVIERR